MILPSAKIEKKLASGGAKLIIGIDEAGRGPLAGPVVASAVWANPGLYEKDFEERILIRDSKTLSEKQRESVRRYIGRCDDFVVGIGEVSHEMVDRMNILNATLLAMRLALDDVLAKLKIKNENFREGNMRILIDGNRKIPKSGLKQHLFPKGDRDIFSISAASICAKVHRDGIMREYHEVFPEYGFDSHKGYGTRFHLEQLQKNGPCKIHRRSFGPVRDIIGASNQ